MTQCHLILLDNVSVSPGSESFTLKHNRVFDVNVRIKEAPEIDMPAFYLLPVTMKSEHWSLFHEK